MNYTLRVVGTLYRKDIVQTNLAKIMQNYSQDLPCTFEPHTVTDLSSAHNPVLASIRLVPVTSMPLAAALRTNWEAYHTVLGAQITLPDLAESLGSLNP